MTDICGRYAAAGSQCVQPKHHDGPHQAIHGFRWTDESDRRTAEYIAKQGGKD